MLSIIILLGICVCGMSIENSYIGVITCASWRSGGGSFLTAYYSAMCKSESLLAGVKHIQQGIGEEGEGLCETRHSSGAHESYGE